jgi:hypothetical protein
MPPRHRFLEPIHNVKEGLAPHVSAAVAAKIWSSYLEMMVEAATRAPSVAAKLRLMARFAALAVLAAGEI